MELWNYERQAWNSGAETVCGVDEAGAGPLMGPVYAAAVILPRELNAFRSFLAKRTGYFK